MAAARVTSGARAELLQAELATTHDCCREWYDQHVAVTVQREQALAESHQLRVELGEQYEFYEARLDALNSEHALSNQATQQQAQDAVTRGSAASSIRRPPRASACSVDIAS